MGVGEDREGLAGLDLAVRAVATLIAGMIVAAHDACVGEEEDVAPARASVEQRVEAGPVEVDGERPRPLVDLPLRQAPHARLLPDTSRWFSQPAALPRKHCEEAGERVSLLDLDCTHQAAVDDGIPNHGAVASPTHGRILELACEEARKSPARQISRRSHQVST